MELFVGKSYASQEKNEKQHSISEKDCKKKGFQGENCWRYTVILTQKENQREKYRAICSKVKPKAKKLWS